MLRMIPSWPCEARRSERSEARARRAALFVAEGLQQFSQEECATRAPPIAPRSARNRVKVADGSLSSPKGRKRRGRGSTRARQETPAVAPDRWGSRRPFQPSRSPDTAPIVDGPGCSIALYCTKREMPEVGSLGGRALEKEVDVDNARERGYKSQPIAPRRALPISRARGASQRRRRRRRHF